VAIDGFSSRRDPDGPDSDPYPNLWDQPPGIRSWLREQGAGVRHSPERSQRWADFIEHSAHAGDRRRDPGAPDRERRDSQPDRGFDWSDPEQLEELERDIERDAMDLADEIDDQPLDEDDDRWLQGEPAVDEGADRPVARDPYWVAAQPVTDRGAPAPDTVPSSGADRGTAVDNPAPLRQGPGELVTFEGSPVDAGQTNDPLGEVRSAVAGRASQAAGRNPADERMAASLGRDPGNSGQGQPRQAELGSGSGDRSAGGELASREAGPLVPALNQNTRREVVGLVPPLNREASRYVLARAPEADVPSPGRESSRNVPARAPERAVPSLNRAASRYVPARAPEPAVSPRQPVTSRDVAAQAGRAEPERRGDRAPGKEPGRQASAGALLDQVFGAPVSRWGTDLPTAPVSAWDPPAASAAAASDRGGWPAPARSAGPQLPDDFGAWARETPWPQQPPLPSTVNGDEWLRGGTVGHRGAAAGGAAPGESRGPSASTQGQPGTRPATSRATWFPHRQHGATATAGTPAQGRQSPNRPARQRQKGRRDPGVGQGQGG
jgi:hypothetical protein